ncbi:MAG: bifunctional (p)ppGpp synthetase/guanosine-3',5'-bis(diphosphate) 3'-pyrophosphohydrolase, partial [Deltaproteobacteria bacterium]|nr:bifunctional (p)ppGpp synthetase/guanosine-3',5'-bis(diphosphate) 3'-pyrophosphohydrolase [Deltaproteobacteria bacterium]
ELEDLSFKYLEPETYAAIESKLAKRKEEREKYVQEVIRVLRTALSNHNIKGEVTGRFKEVYSIYKKMTMHNLDFHDIYDITAFRIIVGTIGECYQTLGILHSLWKPVPGKFKDYIAIPKSNMYQSLHTTVIGPYGERIEIQIRTKEMHQLAEEGIAAHWAYKEGEQHDKKEVRQFEWLRRLMDANTEIKDQKEFLESVKITLFPDEVYVFTPKGEIKEFPIGATPVDFAYSIHTEVGHQCTGAKVNGKLVPLKYELKSGDTVEIITSSHHSPSKDWLSFVKTARARNKITQWIKARQREKSITLGKTMLEKQLKKYHLTLAKLSKNEEFTKLAEEFGFKTEDDLFATVGYGKLTPGQVIGKIIPENFQNGKEEKKEIEQKIDENQEIHVSDEIFVKGTSNIMTRIARCCNPLPGEPIVGFITRGRGITVHVANCPNILAAEPERKVDVEWGVTEDTIYRVRLEIEAIDKKGVLAEMTSVITSNDINIRKVSGGSTGKGNAKNTFEVEVYNVHQLNKLIKDIKGIEGIISVKRVRGLKAV